MQRNPGKSIAEGARDLSPRERHLRNNNATFQKDGLLVQINRRGPRNIIVHEIHILEDFNLTISIATVIRAIMRFNITYKLVRLVPPVRNTPKISKRDLSMYKPILIDVIYVDETGFSLHIRRSYGRSQRGQLARITARMNVSGLVNYRSIVTSYNKTEFEIFGAMLATCIRMPEDFYYG
ncbi:hypothetical protein RF11_06863 [Thelohanellus kitauei]|uniref:Tc1-like transposase DDE domain-containing protein n=1 Tax=Thelohanellus kitauei TaxID=669202 RepID=A0A0C2NGT1_THEKT|nr:hypothetical protein RF11_06863 [Thelohanellus kitauei]